MAVLETLLLVRLCASLCEPPQREVALAASIAHLQLQYFAGCRQLTVLGAAGPRGGPLAAQLRAAMPDVPHRGLSADHAVARSAGLLFPEGLPAHDRLTDLYVVDLRGTSPQSAADGAAAALWARELVNAVVLVVDEADASRVRAFSYEPFSRCRAAPPALQLGEWVMGRWRAQPAQPHVDDGRQALFPRNERLRIGGCELIFEGVESPVTIIVSTRRPRGGWLGLRPLAAPPPGGCQCAGAGAGAGTGALQRPASGWISGVCIEMLMEVSRYAGARVPFCVQAPCDGSNTWGNIFPNGTATSMFADLQAGRATAAGAYFLTQEARYRGVDLVTTGHVNQGVYVVPAGMGQPVSPLCELTRPFPARVWIAVALAAAGSSAVVGRFSRLDHAVGFTLCTLIGVPCAADRVPPHSPLRLFLYVWFTFSFIASAAFLANAKGHLFMAMRNNEIETVEGILNAGLHVIVPRIIAEEILKSSGNDPVAVEFYHRTTFSDNVMNTIIQSVAHERRAATVTLKSHAAHYFKLKAENDWKADIHLLPVKKGLSNILGSWFALRKGSALTPAFRLLANRMMAAGLIQYWFSR
ncbi:Glutamate receptor ionotropic, kainate glr-3 [Frankliniella fusca]|uniref:Glutamate receptor ionotropic, kainate glr-3 n=1 Tax=Frankliniella fusca TaxID=407009 RepID=A0AAE1I2X3_9NEOP|nr:Glutamate receptor ionotropic, kainate glr-3 [Frankliniella fusca]